MSSDDEDLDLDLFQEPAGYRQERSTEKKNTQYTMLDGTTLDLQLIGYDTLWVSCLPLMYHARSAMRLYTLSTRAQPRHPSLAADQTPSATPLAHHKLYKITP